MAKSSKKKNSDSEKLYPAEEQGILHEETEEEKGEAMDLGEEDEEVYTKKGRELLEEDDEIDTWEEGFMEGATDSGQLGKDALTGEPLMDIEDVYELEFNGKTHRFINEKNAKAFLKKQKEKR
ncbi:hypothetical protein HYT55_03765 [Candidatus Woesearchaeota archaeon]|nr:hypothetical protein [Candidatus Woesearchaeota archaeon]